jgi:hypothetical protein
MLLRCTNHRDTSISLWAGIARHAGHEGTGVVRWVLSGWRVHGRALGRTMRMLRIPRTDFSFTYLPVRKLRESWL